MTPNMYRIGDYVYFESSSAAPYQVRRIEELNKTPGGNVEAKVMCFFRRRDISTTLIHLADKHQSSVEEEQREIGAHKELSETERHILEHRELFLSRQMETLPATHIRGKCSVTLLNETEDLMSYTRREDMFFYSLVYDPHQKTLLADKGEIRVGQRYQADNLPEPNCVDDRNVADLEELVWQPGMIGESQVQQFITVARSVGTFARALDCSSSVRQPSLHMSAAAASRDITLFHAMDSLHKNKYSVTEALSSLVTEEGPILCRDEVEEWSPSETSMFEEALEKYGKDFNDIRQDFLPWKILKSIIEYYYMWKTTDKYVQQKKIKSVENESKLKQVYIPNYNKPNPNLLTGKMALPAQPHTPAGLGPRTCEGCGRCEGDHWYAWGPQHMQCRLCEGCWLYWKKYGGLQDSTARVAEASERLPPSQRKERALQYSNAANMSLTGSHPCLVSGCGKEFRHKTNLARHLATAHGMPMRSGSPRPMMKTRAAFCLITTSLTRLARTVCKDLLKPGYAARHPTNAIDAAMIKQECQSRLPAGAKPPVVKFVSRKRRTINQVMAGLGVNVKAADPEILSKEGTGKHPQRLAFPRPAKIAPLPSVQNEAASLKRSYNAALGTRRGFKGDPAAKRTCVPGDQSTNRVRGGPTKSTADNAPADIFFRVNPAVKTDRKQLTKRTLKHMARSPRYTPAASASAPSPSANGGPAVTPGGSPLPEGGPAGAPADGANGKAPLPAACEEEKEAVPAQTAMKNGDSKAASPAEDNAVVKAD